MVLVAVLSGMLRIRFVEQGYHDTMIVGADQLSRGLVSATWHAMLADDRQAAYDTMQTVARQQGISRIRIFNKEGRIMFSTAPETRALVDKNAEACVLCHASAQPLVRVETPSRARIFRDPGGQRRLAMITPIYNEPSCSTAGCHAHPQRQRVLGVLDVALDLGPTDRRLSETRYRILGTIVLEAVLIAGFITVFIGLLVTRPIHRLIEANAAVGRLDLEHSLEIRTSREMYDLAASFNDMRDRLGEAMTGLNRASQELEAKVAERTEQLRQAHQRLLQADRLASLGQLAASVAHEINNPLSGVLNYSALMARILKEDGVPPGRVAEFRGFLERVTEQTARAGRIVSDLLAFSRRSKPHRSPADLNGIVRTTVSLVSHKLKLMGVEADLRLDEAPARAVLRRLAAAAGRAQPGDERRRVDARPRPRPGDRAHLARAARRGRAAGRHRRRRGHPAGAGGPHLRPVRHHQGRGQGARPRPRGGLRHRAGAWRHDRRREPGRLGHRLQCRAAARDPARRRPAAGRQRCRRMSVLCVAAIGLVPEEVLERVELAMRDAFALQPQRLAPLPEPRDAFSPSRGQWSSPDFLKCLLACVPPGAVRLLGVTERDLFVPVLSFVYGQAQLEGSVAVVSLARLRPEFHGLRTGPVRGRAARRRRVGARARPHLRAGALRRPALPDVAVHRPARPRPQDRRALSSLLGAARREP